MQRDEKSASVSVRDVVLFSAKRAKGVIIYFLAPLHLKDEQGPAGKAARPLDVTGNKNRSSGSRKLQSLQVGNTDTTADNMYPREPMATE